MRPKAERWAGLVSSFLGGETPSPAQTSLGSQVGTVGLWGRGTVGLQGFHPGRSGTTQVFAYYTVRNSPVFTM